MDAGDRYLVIATDQNRTLAVHGNANDVAVLGARPLWFFAVMLLPWSGTTPELAETSRDCTAIRPRPPGIDWCACADCVAFIQRVDKFSVPWETVGMSEKRTKVDKAQRQADQLEKKLARRPAQTRNKQRSSDSGKRAPAQTSR